MKVIALLVAIAATTGMAVSARKGPDVCALYIAALEASNVRPDSMLVADTMRIGIPSFAFNAYTGMKSGDQALADSARPKLFEKNRPPIAIPECVSKQGGYRLVQDSTLFNRFSRTGPRWSGWTGVKGFALISQPILSADSMSAVIFVGTAYGPLAGSGRIFRFEADSEGKWIKKSEVLIWVS